MGNTRLWEVGFVTTSSPTKYNRHFCKIVVYVGEDIREKYPVNLTIRAITAKAAARRYIRYNLFNDIWHMDSGKAAIWKDNSEILIEVVK